VAADAAAGAAEPEVVKKASRTPEEGAEPAAADKGKEGDKKKEKK